MLAMTQQAGTRWQTGRDVEESYAFAPVAEPFAAVMEPLEPRLLLSTVEFDTPTKMSYTDAQGSTVVMTLKGGGKGELIFPDIYDGWWKERDVTDNAYPILRITGATAGTTISISVKNKANKSIKTTTLLGMVIEGDGGMKAVNAGKVNIAFDIPDDAWTSYTDHAVFGIENAIGTKITLGDLIDVDMLLGGETATKVTTLKLGVVENTYIDALRLPLSVTATRFDPLRDVDGDIIQRCVLDASYFTKIVVKESFYCHVYTNRSTAVAIESIKVGQVYGGRIWGYDVGDERFIPGGRINSITAGSFEWLDVWMDSIGKVTATGFTVKKEGGYKVKTAGDLHGDLLLAGVNVTKGHTLGSIKATGDMSADLRVQKGTIGTISVGWLFTGEIRVGNQVDEGMYTESIKSVTVGAFDGWIFASSIGTMTVKGYKDRTGAKVSGDLGDKTGWDGSMIVLSGHGVLGNVLGSLKLQGTLFGDLQVYGNMGTISMFDMRHGNIYVDGRAKSITIRNKADLSRDGTENKNYTVSWLGVKSNFRGCIQVLQGTRITVGKTKILLTDSDTDRYVTGLPEIW